MLVPSALCSSHKAGSHRIPLSGLEFDSVALLGFFTYMDQLGKSREWENVLAWLSSHTGITTVQSSESVNGRRLENCDYNLSHPELLDQAMLLYTALTRARNHLFMIEVEELRRKKAKGRAVGLEEYVLRRFKDLGLLEIVQSINEGLVAMTSQEHKARGVLMVTQAIDISHDHGVSSALVKEKFLGAIDRFRPDKGDDKDLLEQSQKHMEALLLKRSIIQAIKKKFFDPATGGYVLAHRFSDVLSLEQECGKFFEMCVGDSFLVDEIGELRALLEDVFAGTPYEVHFGEVCRAIAQHEPYCSSTEIMTAEQHEALHGVP